MRQSLAYCRGIAISCVELQIGSEVLGVVLNIEDGKREPASIERLLELTAADMARVNELILSRPAPTSR